ncbi:16S rRNA (cytosine(967)-C(5))-methyltransferase RsmB [candidate division WOR-3 bacterium]|nr:16S rRNA (cytosine(967)-C(5))-methyltransferase RsmB [candidate division WOR-3 bacterium]MCK4526373.1 16S rRNA (cytosine(967)-C(5))-methyltransferase RsmB [candidate division WOR-3 bacterium]
MADKIKGRELALQSLMEFEKKGDTLKEFLEMNKWKVPRRDIRKAYDYFYGCLRMKKRLDYILNKHLMKYTIMDLPITIRNILRLGTYGLLFSSDPDYAVVDSFVALSRKYGHNGTASLVNGVLRNLHPVEYPEERIEYLATYYSQSEWLVAKLLKIYGEDVEKILEASNMTPRISIRVNRLKIEPEGLFNKLIKEGVKVEKSRISDYNFLTDGKVLDTPSFKEGLFQVQSGTQTLITEILSPSPEEIILDLCSSPGGKSTHIAEMIGDRGMVLSVDLKNLDKVVSNCKRLGIMSVYPILSDARQFCVSRADRIMLDVPCSGTGVMSEKGDIRWRIKSEPLKNLKKLQQELLKAASRNLFSGSVMVYATCSILPEENEEQVYNFIKGNPDFELVPYSEEEMFFINLPNYATPSGGFAAIIKRR